MHYIKWGNGDKNIICLHGWPGDSTKWAELASHLVNNDKSIWAPDLPGWGQTELSEVYTLEKYANQLKKFVEQNSIYNFILIGHSFGGRVAIKYASMYPEDIKKLILIASAGIVDKTWHVKIRIGIAKIIPNFVKKQFHPWLGSRDYQESNGDKRKTFVNVIKEDLQIVSSTINCQTLIIWGDQDRTTPVKYGKIFNNLIKNSKLEIINGDHGLPYRKPHVIAPLIHNFIND